MRASGTYSKATSSVMPRMSTSVKYRCFSSQWWLRSLMWLHFGMSFQPMPFTVLISRSQAYQTVWLGSSASATPDISLRKGSITHPNHETRLSLHTDFVLDHIRFDGLWPERKS